MSNVTNHTEDFDYYCIELSVGPVVWAVFCVLCSLVGGPASMWLLWLLSRKGASGLSKDIYMLNLTIMELIFSVFTIPGVVNVFVWRVDAYTWIFDVFTSFSLSGRPLLMTCICADCYMAVVHPISYMKMKQVRYRTIVSGLVWAITVMYGLVFMYLVKDNLSLVVVPYAVSLPIIAFCDFSILYALRKPDPSGRSEVHPLKQRAMQTITNSFIMTVVAYLPPLVVISFCSLMRLSLQAMYCDVLIPTLISPLIGSVIMPLLHMHNLGHLKSSGRR